MNIRPFLNFLDSLDRRLSIASDYCATVGLVTLCGLIVCGIGYVFWYFIAMLIFDVGTRIEFILLVILLSLIEGFRPGLKWLRKNLEPKSGAV